ncbi:vWA domain-containing protein [Pedobacter nyackensis]|uniref:Ca-activated chloride channel family protein n=1 Tax=Pedobacter nyackensis TaxID=475255 RepID=A0A1W2BHA3_9SPHI|nr:VWA domain-containing protein [Pedobacter nyackensis]SMC72323.1 Ca-activated chloride channel family protein [Pedobacter nyackensis]
MKTILLPLFLLIFMGFQESRASDKIITGTVTDKTYGQPTPGVIVSTSVNKYVTTNIEGKYSITVENNTQQLRFSYLAYKTLTVKIGKSKVINVALEQDHQTLSEVVITGYAPKMKSQTTGAVVTASQNIMIRGVSSSNKSYNPTQPNTESYASIKENGFQNTYKNPLSTFSIDVDAAAYSNVRRFINNGGIPPKDAVRVEEMINYFDYEYQQPKGKDPVNIVTEIATAPWNTKHKLVQIGLQGRKISTDNLPASNMVFLIDVSGSMNYANKLPLLVSSFKLLTDQLRPKDKVAIVVYAGNAGLVLPATSGNDKAKIKDALNALSAGGSTAGGAGIELAYNIASKNYIKGGNNRVILATDGDFNVGASSDKDMESLIEEKRKTGIFLTVLGYGMGNTKDSKMETLADKGNGNYAYIDNISEARKVLINEFGGTLFTIAKDVKLQVEFNPDKVQAYRLIGYENRLLEDRDFNDDKKDAGEMGSGHTVTALYEVIPTGVKSSFSGSVDDLKYQENKKSRSGNSKEMLTVKLRYKDPDGDSSKLLQEAVVDQSASFESASSNFKFAASVAEFGMLLRQSDFKQNATFDHVIRTATQAMGTDKEGYRSEFIRLAKSAKLMAEDLLSSIKK